METLLRLGAVHHVAQDEEGNVRFYCRDFDARLVDIESEGLPDREDVLK